MNEVRSVFDRFIWLNLLENGFEKLHRKNGQSWVRSKHKQNFANCKILMAKFYNKIFRKMKNCVLLNARLWFMGRTSHTAKFCRNELCKTEIRVSLMLGLVLRPPDNLISWQVFASSSRFLHVLPLIGSNLLLAKELVVLMTTSSTAQRWFQSPI